MGRQAAGSEWAGASAGAPPVLKENARRRSHVEPPVAARRGLWDIRRIADLPVE